MNNRKSVKSGKYYFFRDWRNGRDTVFFDAIFKLSTEKSEISRREKTCERHKILVNQLKILHVKYVYSVQIVLISSFHFKAVLDTFCMSSLALQIEAIKGPFTLYDLQLQFAFGTNGLHRDDVPAIAPWCVRLH